MHHLLDSCRRTPTVSEKPLQQVASNAILQICPFAGPILRGWLWQHSMFVLPPPPPHSNPPNTHIKCITHAQEIGMAQSNMLVLCGSSAYFINSQCHCFRTTLATDLLPINLAATVTILPKPLLPPSLTLSQHRLSAFKAVKDGQWASALCTPASSVCIEWIAAFHHKAQRRIAKLVTLRTAKLPVSATYMSVGPITMRRSLESQADAGGPLSPEGGLY